MLEYCASPVFVHCKEKKKKEKKIEDACSTEKLSLVWYSATHKAKVS